MPITSCGTSPHVSSALKTSLKSIENLLIHIFLTFSRYLRFFRSLLIRRTCLDGTAHLFHAVLSFEMCNPASASREGYDVCLGNMTTRKVLWLSASKQYCPLKLSSPKSTNSAVFPSFPDSFVTYPSIFQHSLTY